MKMPMVLPKYAFGMLLIHYSTCIGTLITKAGYSSVTGALLMPYIILNHKLSPNVPKMSNGGGVPF